MTHSGQGPIPFEDLTPAETATIKANRTKVEAYLDNMLEQIQAHRAADDTCDGYFCLGEAATALLEANPDGWAHLLHGALNRLTSYEAAIEMLGGQATRQAGTFATALFGPPEVRGPLWNHDPNAKLATVAPEDLKAIMDIVATSLDMQSGMLETSEVETLRKVATHLGLDPELWTPSTHPHKWVPYRAGFADETLCGRGSCFKTADDPIHVKEGP